MQAVAAAWLMATLTPSALMVSLVQASSSLPVVLLALWAGAVADAFDRRRVMIAAQIVMLGASAILALLSWRGMLGPVPLLALTFLVGAGNAVNWPSMQVAVGEIVPPALLPRAVALNGMGVNLARSLGPAIGGAVLTGLGATAAFLLNAASFLPLLAMLGRWRHRPPPRTMPRERIWPAMVAGLRYGLLSPAIVAIALRSLLFGLFATAIPSLMPVVARDLLGGGPLAFGALLAAFGIGAIGGALVSARLRARWSTEAIIRRLSLLLAAAAAVAGASPSLPVTMAAMAMAGAAWLVVLTSFNVATQSSSPRWVVARTLSLYQMATYGGMTIGSWIFGWLAEARGCPLALGVTAIGAVAVAAIGLVSPIDGDRADLTLRTDWRVPDTALPMDPRSGPIVLAIEHRVRADDADAFVAVMTERSRILRRDGARAWSLRQDIGDPDLWVETYQLPTWLDYVLLNRRRTEADAAIRDAIARLRSPGTAPVVHRYVQRHARGASRAAADLVEDRGGLSAGTMP